MDNLIEAPERIWIEANDECPYFYEAHELHDVEEDVIEYVRADKLEELAAALAERNKEIAALRRLISSTHKRAVKHTDCENTSCPICVGGLFVCADCGAVEIETEQRICSHVGGNDVG